MKPKFKNYPVSDTELGGFILKVFGALMILDTLKDMKIALNKLKEKCQ